MFVQAPFSSILKNQLLSDITDNCGVEQANTDTLGSGEVWVHYAYYDWD
jgi:hypothetical protein